MKDAEGIATSVIALIVVLAVVAGAGIYLLVTGTGGTSQGGVGENEPTGTPGENGAGDNKPPSTPEVPTSGPYLDKIYSATSSNGINWVVDNTMVFNHASVPGAVYFENKLYVYFVNAADWENEKLSVGISTDRGATFTTHDVQISGSNSPYPVDPNPIVQDNKIRLTYLGNFNQGETGKIVTANSTDGINFTEDGVIFTADVYDPDLFYDEVGGEWVLLLNTGGLTKATASSPTATFTEDTSFNWSEGSISSTHKIEDKYYTYYAGTAAGAGGVCVAEYSNGALTNVANRILNYQGLNADPTVAIFGTNDYKMYFKTRAVQQG